jgi:energy-coupling factor transporter transmembrane protein EcfT
VIPFPFQSLHPAVRLLFWAGLVMAGQGLEAGWLAGFTFLALVVGGLLAGAHLRRLMRRARFLLLTIGLLFACGTPGEALLPLLGAASPTLAGLEMAAQHCARLALVLALLALLFQSTSSSQLVAGVFGLLKPFSPLGLSRERVALRLMLVLQYAEDQKGEGRLKSWKQWLNWLECQDGGTEAEPVRIVVAPLHGADFAVLGLLLLAGFGLLL